MPNESHDVSIGEFAGRTVEFLKEVRESQQALVLTEDGKAKIVVQDAASYGRLLDRLDALEMLDGIKQGMEDLDAGRVVTLGEFEREFRARHGIPSRRELSRLDSAHCR